LAISEEKGSGHLWDRCPSFFSTALSLHYQLPTCRYIDLLLQN
jgi:hypothetical protein